MAARPAVLPETFSGKGSFTEWLDHFETVAEVNGWDNAAKALWLRVRLVGRAQKAVKSLSAEDRADYAKAKEQLTKRFEPESKCALYEAEFQARKKQPVEDWATFGEDLKSLADKAFPDLDDVAIERLTVSNFLGQLDQQLAFSVRQRKPKTIADAVTAGLELESYRLAPSNPSPASNSLPEPSFIDAVQTKHDAVIDMMQQLMARMDKLETEVHRSKRSDNGRGRGKGPSGNQKIVCRRCGIEGHYARGCAAPQHQDQGND